MVDTPPIRKQSTASVDNGRRCSFHCKDGIDTCGMRIGAAMPPGRWDARNTNTLQLTAEKHMRSLQLTAGIDLFRTYCDVNSMAGSPLSVLGKQVAELAPGSGYSKTIYPLQQDALYKMRRRDNSFVEMSIGTNHCVRARSDFRNEDEHPVSRRMEPVVIMDESDAVKNDYIEASRKFMEFFDRAGMFIYGARDVEHRLMRLDCVMLALGRHHIVNHNTAASLARMHGVPEQSIVGTMKRFQDFLGLPPVNGQNTDEQRKEKSKARKGNLK